MVFIRNEEKARCLLRLSDGTWVSVTVTALPLWPYSPCPLPLVGFHLVSGWRTAFHGACVSSFLPFTLFSDLERRRTVTTAILSVLGVGQHSARHAVGGQ